MKRIFIDTNILLDVLMERGEFAEPAQMIWGLVQQRIIKASVAAISFNNIFHIVRKSSASSGIYEALELLQRDFIVMPLDDIILKRALAERWPDFEDAIQYHSGTCL